MSGFKNKETLSISEKYYVDLHCICCGICTLIAPMNFLVNLPEECGYVAKQPENKDEIQAMEKAVKNCPVGAIRIDSENGHS